MIKLVTGIVKPHAFEQVKDQLKAIGVEGITVTEVRGYGRQGGHTETYRGAEYTIDLVPKIKVEILCRVEDAVAVVEAVRKGAFTGKIGDGKVWVVDVDHLMRVRTGEVGDSAL